MHINRKAWCLLGGNPNRYQPVLLDRKNYPVLITGFSQEVSELTKSLTKSSLWTIDGERTLLSEEGAFDTLTNFSRDIKNILELEFGGCDEVILLVPTSPTHFWRAQKIVKMLSWFYPIFRNVRLEKVDSYKEDDGALEPTMKTIYRYGGWFGIMLLCLVARLQRIGKE